MHFGERKICILLKATCLNKDLVSNVMKANKTENQKTNLSLFKEVANMRIQQKMQDQKHQLDSKLESDPLNIFGIGIVSHFSLLW